NPDIEIDVLTPHHKDYYAGNRQVATDDEDPVPIPFPAYSKGHVFAFGVIEMKPSLSMDSSSSYSIDGLVELAQLWLKNELQVLGIGAKTSAVYGWFSDVTF